MHSDIQMIGIGKTKPPVDNFFSLLSVLDNDEDIKPSSPHYQWLKNGLFKCVAGGEGYTIDKALGLAVCGSRHISTQLNLRVRNAYLAESIKLIAFNESLTDWERCKRLSSKINHLSDFWTCHPCVLDLDSWEGWKINLYNAWAIGCGLPSTTRGLYSVIENNAYSLHSLEMRIHKTIIEARSNEKLVRNKGGR